MGNMGLYKLASGCGITDYILCKEMRDVCDVLFACAGILMIMALVYAKKRIINKEG